MNPILLVGAALVGLPIVLHLIMKQEPKRLPFPAFRFLQQRLKTNQRKLRLRHFLLLALRMLLIALFCFTLYQPMLQSVGAINFHGDQPLAVVLILDTSPGMGYADGNETHLQEACRRAGELLAELPDASRVAVIETGDPAGDWSTVTDARSRLKELAENAPKAGQPVTAAGSPQPVTSALAVAYQLFRTVDQQSESADPLPRLVAVFTDRAASSWDASRVEDLKKLQESIPDPKPAHAIVDVGTDTPVNVGILSTEMSDGRPQVVPAGPPVGFTVTVAAVGLDAKATVTATLDDQPAVAKEIEVPHGQTRSVGFEFLDVKPGLHHVRFELPTKDALMADNARFFTFRVAEARKVLTVADDPTEAAFWELAVNVKREFACEVVTPNTLPADLGGYEAVVLLSVAHPSAELWAKLQKYVEAGGKLIVIPGAADDKAAQDAYNGEAASKLLPGILKRVVDTANREEFPTPKDAKAKDRSRGVEWSVFADPDDRALAHPMLAPIRDWKAKGDVDAVRKPRRAYKYWEVEPRGDGAVIVTYDDADEPKKRRPAVLERAIRGPEAHSPPGKVLLLTTRMDMPPGNDWNDYWEANNSWVVAFPELLLRYAAGSATEANFNFPTGQTVTVPLAKLLGGTRDPLILTGPGIAGADARVIPAERQTEFRFSPPRSNVPGNYTLTPTTADGPPRWQEGFSLNIPPEESTLDKVPVEGIETLTGPNSVVPLGKSLALKDVIGARVGYPVELFPWLLIAVLLLLAGEGLIANRFYGRPK